MADTIERTIYKLEIDDSGYIRGVESLSASTNRFAQVQEEANKRLRTNEAALKNNTQVVDQAKKSLDSYTGTNVKYRQQLERDVKKAEADQIKLTQTVDQSRQAYEKATLAAAQFAQTTARANQLQPQPGARIAPQPVVQQPSPLSQFNTGELTDIIQNTTSDFTALAAAIELAEQAMAGLDEESEEFKTLAPIVEQGKVVLQEYTQAAEQAAGGQTSLRTQIRQGREELVKLEQQGKANTKEYFELEKRVAKLTDAFGDQQQRIKILASDTKLLDFGKGAITAATSAFQAFTAVQILSGDQSEELQKKTMQLFAAMQLLQSLEQLSNLTRREGVLATLAQSAAQSAYTAVVGASTGALRAFRLAVVGTGVGVAVVAITALVIAYRNLQSEIEEAAKDQKTIADIHKEAAKAVGDEVAKLIIYQDKLNDTNIPLNERIKIAKEYNKTADEANKIDLKQIENLDLINEKIEAQNKLILQRAIALAATAKLGEVAGGFIDAELELNRALERTGKTRDIFLEETENFAIKFRQSGGGSTELIKEMQKFFGAVSATEIIGFFKIVENRKKAQSELDEANRLLAPLITTNSLIKTEPTKDDKSVENVFTQERDRLLAALAKLRVDEAESIKSINDEFAAKLIVEQNRIAGLLKDKKITPDEETKLLKLAVEVNKTELDKALADFNKKVTDARKKLNDELLDLQNKNNEDTLNLIQDDFERRSALIDFNEKEALAQAEQNQIDRIAALDLDAALLGEQAYQDAKAIIVTEGEQGVTNITRRFAAERQDLAADIFKRSLDAIANVFDEQLLQLDEETAGQVQQQKDLLDRGLINYEQFQRNITQILRVEKENRDKLRLDELNAELAAINKRLEATTDATEREELQKRKRSVQTEIADINTQTTDVVDPNSKRVETVAEYVTQVAALADSVIQFWQAANEAESEALDRSIALQEKRVEAALRIAQRGNAQYLKAEEDRLKELQVARENAARRDLAINAALQASQLLVGITGAIAKIATPGIGIAETIGAIAVIVSSLAAGFGLVRSLQGNQPTFAEGTTYVQRGKQPRGKDTIPAWLDEGEAVTSAEKNKQYHPTIKAIHEGTIPAEQLNKFVTTYHKIKPVPQPNYERIKDAAEIKINQDGRMAVALGEQNKLIAENNDLQRQTLRAMKSMSVSASIDRDGVAIMVNEYIQQIERDKKI